MHRKIQKAALIFILLSNTSCSLMLEMVEEDAEIIEEYAKKEMEQLPPTSARLWTW